MKRIDLSKVSDANLAVELTSRGWTCSSPPRRDLKSELVSYVIERCESLSDMSMPRHDRDDLVIITEPSRWRRTLCYKSKDVERARGMFIDCLREDVPDEDDDHYEEGLAEVEERVRLVMTMKIGEHPK